MKKTFLTLSLATLIFLSSCNGSTPTAGEDKSEENIKATEVELNTDSVFLVVDQDKVDKNNISLYLNQMIEDIGGDIEDSYYQEGFMEHGYILQYGDIFYLYSGGNRKGETYSIGMRIVDLTKPFTISNDDKNYYLLDDSENVLMGNIKPQEIYYGVYSDGDKQMPVIYGTNAKSGYRMDMIFDISDFEYIYFNELFNDENDSEIDIFATKDTEQNALFQSMVGEYI